MVVGIISVVAAVLALGCLAVLVRGLLRRIKNLDAQLATASGQVAALNDVLAQAPGKAS